MADNIQLRILRKPEVLALTGFKKSTLYTRIKEGLMPSPISLGGARAVGWIDHEIQTVLAAFCAGKSPDEIKQLVTELVAKRSELV
jgi:prophage regulatory protein